MADGARLGALLAAALSLAAGGCHGGGGPTGGFGAPRIHYPPEPCPAGTPAISGGFVDLVERLAAPLDLGSLTGATELGVEPLASAAYFGDLDGDGVSEVVAGKLDGPGDATVLRYDPASGGLVPTGVTVPRLRGVGGLVDLDGDGVIDVIGKDASAAVVWGLGGGVLSESATAIRPVTGDPELAAFAALLLADVDHDGWLDLITGEGRAGCDGVRAGVHVYLRTGARRFDEAPLLGPQPIPLLVTANGVAPLAGDAPVLILIGTACGDLPPFFYREGAPDGDGYPTFTPLDPFSPPGGERFIPSAVWAAMGTGVGDLDGDGHLELSLTGNPDLQTWTDRDGLPLTEVSAGIGVDVVGPPPQRAAQIPWGVLYVDVDRDGRRDIVVSHGDDVTAFFERRIGSQWTTAFWNMGDGFRFCEFTDALGVARPGNWRILAYGDLEGDGDVDLAVGGYGEGPRVLRNDVDGPGHGFALRLRGTSSNHLGVGAVVDVEVAGLPAQRYLVTEYFPTLFVQEPLVFVGTGAALAADRVTITWPSGTRQELRDVAAGRLHEVVEPPVVTVEPAGRRVPADGVSTATVRITPRSPDGAVDGAATVEAAVAYGTGTLAGPAARDGDGWVVRVIAPATAGSAVVQVSVDGKAVGVRPRIWWE